MKSLPDNIKTLPELSSQSILLSYRGSIAHNLYQPSNEPNSIDDIDLMGICVPEVSYYFGLDKFAPRDTKEMFIDEWDIVCYELRKFVYLLMKGNPNVISMLYLKPEHYLVKHPAAELLIENRALFNSHEIYHSFIGYAKAQLYKTEHMAFKGYMGEKRKKLVEKFGYDTKNAGHLIRLMMMCNEWLVEKNFEVYRDFDRQFLLNIKNGIYSLDQIKEMAANLFTKGEALFKAQQKTIPETVDTKAVNELLLEMYKKIDWVKL